MQQALHRPVLHNQGAKNVIGWAVHQSTALAHGSRIIGLGVRGLKGVRIVGGCMRVDARAQRAGVAARCGIAALERINHAVGLRG